MSMPPPDPVYLLRGEMGPVHSMLFQINSIIEYLYAGTAAGEVYIWDLKRNRQLSQLSIGDEPCLTLHLVNNSNLLTQQKCGKIDMFAAADSHWASINSLNTEYCSFCRCQKLSEDIIAIPFKNSIISLLSLKSFNVESELNPASLPYFKSMGEIMAIKPVKNAHQLILAAYEGGQIILWDMKKKEALSTITIESCPMTLDFDSCLMRGIVGSSSDKLECFELSTSHMLSNTSKLTLKNSGTSIIVIRPDTKIFAAGGWDGLLRIFSWKRLHQLAVLDTHRDTIYDIVYSSCQIKSYDNKHLMAVAGKDGSISLWDIYN